MVRGATGGKTLKVMRCVTDRILYENLVSLRSTGAWMRGPKENAGAGQVCGVPVTVLFLAGSEGGHEGQSEVNCMHVEVQGADCQGEQDIVGG